MNNGAEIGYKFLYFFILDDLPRAEKQQSVDQSHGR